MATTVRFPLYQLPPGFRWRVEQQTSYTFVVAIEARWLPLPPVTRRWRKTVAANFPDMDDQEASDLLEKVSDMVAAQWAEDWYTVDRLRGKVEIAVAMLRLRRTPLLTTASTSWPDVSGKDFEPGDEIDLTGGDE